MSNPCAVTVPLSRIARIQIYVNTRRQTLAKIMRQTGADYGLNGTLYNMRTLAVNCHLKEDGKVLAAPGYTVAGYAWDTGPDIRMDMLPNGARNYIACTPLIVSGKALEELTYDPGQGGKRGRSAIGIKCDRLALYCSRDGSATTLTNQCYYYMFSRCTSLKLSSTQTGEYTQEYRIPSSGEGVTATNALADMFNSTGGTFKGTPSINTTYYLSTDNMIVRETEITTLNGYVDSMIDAAIDKYADTAEYIIPSSTQGSTKKFKITVDDSGTLTATEVT